MADVSPELDLFGVPLYVYNALCVLALLTALAWAVSLLLRGRRLLLERKLISEGRVLDLEDPSEHPDWLERAYVTRLANRQAREIPSVPVETQSVPFAVDNLKGAAQDPYTAQASAMVEHTGEGGEYCWLFAVQRAQWTALKDGSSRVERFNPETCSVRFSEWTPFKGGESVVKPAVDGDGGDLSDDAAAMAITLASEDVHLFEGKHHPRVDDVSAMLLLRSGRGWVMAVTAASDMRMLETFVWTPEGQVMSVRDTFAEDDDDDCLVCCAEPKNTILLPCRHVCCCQTCLARMDKCPVCRSPVESFVSFGQEAERHQVAARPEEVLTMEDLQDIELQPM